MRDSEKGFSEEQERFLDTDAFISKVLSGRKGESSSTFWKTLLESSGGTALITIVVGGLFAWGITNRFQAGQAERDFVNRVLETYNENKLAATEKALQSKVKALDDGLLMIGSVFTRSQSRISIDGPDFAVRLDADEEAKNRKQIEDVRAQFNVTWEDWDTRKRSLEFAIGLHVSTEAEAAWHELVESADGFIVCADKHRPATMGSCVENEAAVQATIGEFLAAARRSDVVGTIITKQEVQEIRSAFEP